MSNKRRGNKEDTRRTSTPLQDPVVTDRHLTVVSNRGSNVKEGRRDKMTNYFSPLYVATGRVIKFLNLYLRKSTPEKKDQVVLEDCDSQS